MVCQVSCASEQPLPFCHLLCLALAKLTICRVPVWHLKMGQYLQLVYQTTLATMNDRYPGHLVICGNCQSNHHVIVLFNTHLELASRGVMQHACIVGDLVVGQQQEAHVHAFNDGPQPRHCCTNAHSHKPVLCIVDKQSFCVRHAPILLDSEQRVHCSNAASTKSSAECKASRF